MLKFLKVKESLTIEGICLRKEKIIELLKLTEASHIYSEFIDYSEEFERVQELNQSYRGGA